MSAAVLALTREDLFAGLFTWLKNDQLDNMRKR